MYSKFICDCEEKVMIIDMGFLQLNFVMMHAHNWNWFCSNDANRWEFVCCIWKESFAESPHDSLYHSPRFLFPLVIDRIILKKDG